MSGLCENRVCVVTGAGRGLGRAYALALAAQGARVVVNDLGTSLDGSGEGDDPAASVVEEIQAAGGVAVADRENISSWDGADRLVAHAVEAFGHLDVMVNNAGIVRDRTIARMSESEWDDVVRVHLKGAFATTHWSAIHWKARAATDGSADGRLINTTSVSGLFGNVGQANYAAAKAGIVGLTLVASMELGRYGVTANAVSPGALTRMTEGLRELDDEARAQRDPAYPAAAVTWLASTASHDVTGRVVLCNGQRIAVANGFSVERFAEPSLDPTATGARLEELVAAAAPNADLSGTRPSQ